MFYHYAIIDQSTGDFALPRGLEDAAVEILPCDDLGVVASQISAAPLRNAHNAHIHMDVLTALMQHRSVVPSGFGATYLTRDNLLQTVSSMRKKLTAELKRLNGQIELSIRVTDRRPLLLQPVVEIVTGDVTGEDADASTEEPKLRYFTTKGANAEKRVRQFRGNAALAETVKTSFAPIATAQSWRALPSPSGRPRISASFLLPRESLLAFHDGLKTLREADPRLDIFMTGPWPPFSFVSENGNVAAGTPDRAPVAMAVLAS